MAHLAYLTINGKTQGLISSGCNSQDSIGSRHQIDHLNQITVLACEHSLQKHNHQHRKSHDALRITKPVDKSSPLLGTAFSRQEILQCDIHFYRTNDKGYNEHYYTIRLMDALLSGINFVHPHSSSESGLEAYEVISLRYRDIVWIHPTAGTEGYDAWE